MNLLSDWALSLIKKPQSSIPTITTIRGAVDKHSGPTWYKAGATVVLEPHETFEAKIALDVLQMAKSEGIDQSYLDECFQSFLFGLFDETVLGRDRPISLFKVQLIGLEYDPVESSSFAFRLAGRDAGKQLVAQAG